MTSRLHHSRLIGLAVITFLLTFSAVSYAQTATYMYDELNRLKRVEYSNGAVVEYRYDGAGNRLQVLSPDTTPPTTTATPPGGLYNANQSVTLTCDDGSGSGCDKIYYTTNGSTPTVSSSVYTSPISITATTTLNFFAQDRDGGACYGNAGGGSGGAIKLMANTVTATGTINALGGTGSGAGGVGRIRVEAYTANIPYGTNPMYTYGQPGSVVVSNTPTLRITSIGAASAPANPAGSFSSPDILLPSGTTNPVSVAVAASYIPVGTTVTIRVIPRTGTATSTTTTLTGVTESSTGTASVSISTTTTTVIMASATFTVAMNYEGEKIEKAVVRAYPGRESETTYITQSGREIKATEVMARNFSADNT